MVKLLKEQSFTPHYSKISPALQQEKLLIFFGYVYKKAIFFLFYMV